MPVKCKFCGKVFSNQSNHNRHINEVHNEVAEPISYERNTVWSSHCLEPNCNRSFSNKNLMQHLHNEHSMNFVTESYIFKNTNGYRVKDVDKRSRLLNSQGSCKMKNSCTSELKVTKESIKITVEWQKVHYGLTLELQHDCQNQISRVLLLKWILESTRDRIGEHLRRIDLLTSRDLRNIGNSCSVELRNGKRDPNDAFSIALSVEECEKLQQNPILFYKRQGKEHSILKGDDFCIIVMNTFQKQIIRKFPRIITIDSTHGLNGYDFEMTTIMVLQEFHHGFPVAEMFSNRKDTVVYRLFFTVAREEVDM